MAQVQTDFKTRYSISDWKIIRDMKYQVLFFVFLHGSLFASGEGFLYFRRFTITLRNDTLYRTPLVD
jgi:hypothetical protein